MGICGEVKLNFCGFVFLFCFFFQSEIEEAKASLKDFYSSGGGSSVTIKSFYFRVFSKK